MFIFYYKYIFMLAHHTVAGRVRWLCSLAVSENSLVALPSSATWERPQAPWQHFLAALSGYAPLQSPRAALHGLEAHILWRLLRSFLFKFSWSISAPSFRLNKWCILSML